MYKQSKKCLPVPKSRNPEIPKCQMFNQQTCLNNVQIFENCRDHHPDLGQDYIRLGVNGVPDTPNEDYPRFGPLGLRSNGDDEAVAMPLTPI